MKSIGSTNWTVYNGHPVLVLEAVHEVGPNDSMRNEFSRIDRVLAKRLSYLCLSPETIPTKQDLSNALQG